MKPPFLDGRVVFTKQLDPVPVVKDPTSDMCTIAREGSALLRHHRETRDRSKMRQRFWELAGTKTGDILGIKKEKGATEDSMKDEDEDGDGDGFNYKASSQYASHMKKAAGSDAQSHFARSRTIRSQREFLPIFTVRDQLLQVIRDNQSS